MYDFGQILKQGIQSLHYKMKPIDLKLLVQVNGFYSLTTLKKGTVIRISN
jgi:hypothetical protein